MDLLVFGLQPNLFCNSWGTITLGFSPIDRTLTYPDWNNKISDLEMVEVDMDYLSAFWR
jgi:hypothetical protein